MLIEKVLDPPSFLRRGKQDGQDIYQVYNKMGYGFLESVYENVGLILNFGESKVEIKRKARTLCSDEQDKPIVGSSTHAIFDNAHRH